MTDLNCPYCDAGLEVCHDDGFGYAEDELHQMECRMCGKAFVFTTAILYHYSAEKADCLNGAPHEYERTHTYPKEFAKMRCTMCGDERPMTEEEKHGVPPVR